jgi:hypothetical protein
MRFHGSGDLHRGQNEATGRVDHEIEQPKDENAN